MRTNYQTPCKKQVKEFIFNKVASLQTLKELRNCISSIIRMWSLFCSIRVYARLHFLTILLETRFLSFRVFCAFCLFCIELDVIFINFITFA